MERWMAIGLTLLAVGTSAKDVISLFITGAPSKSSHGFLYACVAILAWRAVRQDRKP